MKKGQLMSFGRIRLYHRDFPKGQVVDNEADLWQAIDSGWVDAPWEVENPDYVVTAYQRPEPEPEPLKPWQKAVAAKKAKAEARASEAQKS